MEGIHSMHGRRLQARAAYALIEALAEHIATGWQAVAGRIAALRKEQRRAQARRELHELDDRLLKDIGLERSQIDGMFR